MTVRALVIDDDPAIVEEVSEILASLGHSCVSAACMESAIAQVELERFDYILLDLQIPVGSVSKFPRVENGKNLLRQIRERPGMRRTPIIIMTGYGNDGPYQAVELMRLGAVHYVPKPFGLGVGPTLDEAIRAAVPDLENGETPLEDGDQPLESFVGGELAYSEACVMLDGVAIAGPSGRSFARKILDLLNQPSSSGARRTWQSFSGAAIAKKIGAADENAVSSAIKKLRAKITKHLASELYLGVAKHGVVENLGQGYRLADHITVAGSQASPNDPVNEQDDPINDPVNEQDDAASRRQAWAMIELKRGHSLRRSDLMCKFDVSGSTAKRDFQALTKAGQVEFVGPKKTGHYRLQGDSR